MIITHDIERNMHSRICGMAVLTLAVTYPVTTLSQEVVKDDMTQVEKVALVRLGKLPVLEGVSNKVDPIREIKHGDGSGNIGANEKLVSDDVILETVMTGDELAAVRPLPGSVNFTPGIQAGLVDDGKNINDVISSGLTNENNINTRRRKVNVEGVAMLRRMLWMTLFYSGSK